jgi:hypothetical protein
VQIYYKPLTYSDVSPEAKEPQRCSFCGKPQPAVAKLLQGPNVSIGNECVRICEEILADEAADSPDERAAARSAAVGSFTCPRCRTTFALQASAPGGAET